MKKTAAITILSILFLILPAGYILADNASDISHPTGLILNNSGNFILLAQADTGSDYSDDLFSDYGDDFNDELNTPHDTIADPLESINRISFRFNDKLYFRVLKPVATGYKTVMPQPARKGVKNFFNNLSFPVRFVNCLLQGKFEGAGHEFGRFFINSTIGIAGFMDIATSQFEIKEHDEDFGQTLGSYGIGHGFFINWPILGPSSVADTVGTVGDTFLSPLHYADIKTKYDLAIQGFELINSTSLKIGDYEDLKKAALDPYVAYRDAYYQYRQAQIRD